MKLFKVILIILVFLFLALKVFNFFSTPNIKIINKTHLEIRSDSLQYIENGKEPSEEDLMSWKYSADVIAPFHTETRRLNFDKRFVKEPLFFDIGVRYENSPIEVMYDLQGVTFRDRPAFTGQKAYCGYKVEVYPNKKTIVTPTRKWLCIRPMYYHER